jgi:hypothetical protein
VRPNISEFSYGFALTWELLNRFHLVGFGAPVFPSLKDEGAFGYDVRLPGIPIFLQFKLTELMLRSTAKEAHFLGLPYFRMHLRPLRLSNQHQLLIDLEASGEVVYYACPEFSEPAELHVAFDCQEVVWRSAFWGPGAIGALPDDREHYIAFKAQHRSGHLCSERSEVPRAPLHELLVERPVRLGRESDKVRPRPQTFQELSDELIGLYARRMRIENALAPTQGGRTDRSPLDDLALVASSLFDCGVGFIPPG